MNRKWSVLTLTAAVVTLLAAGASRAQHEHSPLAEIMEQVNSTSNLITKAVRTPISYNKSQQDVVTGAQELAKLAGEARQQTSAVEKAKDVPDAQAKWNGLMDQLIAKSNDLAKVAGTGTWDKAKKAHTAVKGVCTECHSVFRIDESDF
jgi:soluble cytochrome b562